MTSRCTGMLLLALLMAACQPASSPPPSTPTAPSAPLATLPGQQRPAPAPLPAATDAQGATPEAARLLVLAYYQAINARDFARAYAYWDRDGRASGQSLEVFRTGYANTRSVQAEAGVPHDAQGAAGSRFIQVPVTLAATQADGSVRHYHGDFVLRAAVADGASQAQRRWHLDSARLERDDAQ